MSPADSVTTGDAIGTLMVIASVIWAIRKLRSERASGVDPVVMTSVSGLIIAATVFFAIALVMAGFGIADLVLHPTEVFDSPRVGIVHDWATGLVALEVGAAMGLCGAALAGKARRLIGARATMEPIEERPEQPPPAAAVIVRLDPVAARRVALGQLDQPATSAHALAAIARRFLADAHGATGDPPELLARLRRDGQRAPDWQALLADLEAARWSGSPPNGLQQRLRELVAG